MLNVVWVIKTNKPMGLTSDSVWGKYVTVCEANVKQCMGLILGSTWNCDNTIISYNVKHQPQIKTESANL